MNDNVVDLRSDTVTQPTPEMRRAMAEAELGDDVLGDDPTVIALEERAAEVTGKEAALFVPSGTMGNLVSHLAHVPRGGEIITPAGSHMVYHEAGGHAVVVGARTREIPWYSDGTVDLDSLRDAFRDPSDEHNPITALVHLENTHSDSMAQPVPAEHISAVASSSRAAVPSATAALKIRAPSTCSGTPPWWAISATAERCSAGTGWAIESLCVFSRCTSAVIGLWTSVGSRKASRRASMSTVPSENHGISRVRAPTTTACPPASW